MILKKNRKMQKMRFFLNIHKKSVRSKHSRVWWFLKLARRVCNHMYFSLLNVEIARDF